MTSRSICLPMTRSAGSFLGTGNFYRSGLIVRGSGKIRH